ncbi:RcnB family protein [Mesorhizobium sp. CA7]|uniref:RcnB family protein n=1 Tax=Mesorhizobium sp. CA7 TaxID=588501 RepID=UPI001CCD3CDF|nr:RcnB family protein [Mesorhizobium sp. CA7]MBZ9814787.1 RcnB family protein [Mesorhizobium sp. CA7]
MAQRPKIFQLEASPAVRDWNRYGLRRPGPGQEWIRVGNDYLLVSILSGIVFGAIAAQ